MIQFRQTKVINFNNKQTVMLRRKNNEQSYVQPHADQSPYRFKRTNANLSPGLSPMRCRTPTKTVNVSPFRAGKVNDNPRALTPIKFINRANNPQVNGFLRSDSTNAYFNQNQKHATYTNNNGLSIRKQSCYDNSNNSKINIHHEKMAVHQNTKLFSKLVSKLNSEKKLEPQITKKYIKPEAFKLSDAPINQVKLKQVPKLTNKKSQSQQFTMQPIIGHIKPVQSVFFQQKQNNYYQTSTNTYFYNQKNISHHQKKTQVNKLVLNQQPLPSNTNNYMSSDINDQNQQKTTLLNNLKYKVLKPTNNFDQAGQKSRENEKYKSNTQKTIYQTNFNRRNDVFNEEQSEFNDVRMYLDKLNESKALVASKDDSVNNKSQSYANIHMSLMNMDPFI